MLRNVGPVPGPYRLGHIFSYCRDPRVGEKRQGFNGLWAAESLDSKLMLRRQMQVPAAVGLSVTEVQCVCRYRQDKTMYHTRIAYQCMATQTPSSTEMHLEALESKVFLTRDIQRLKWVYNRMDRVNEAVGVPPQQDEEYP